MSSDADVNNRTPARRKASTADIVGGAPAIRPVPAKWERQYRNLMELRDALRNRKDGLAAAAKQEQPVFSLHMADAGTDQYDLDFALSMMSSEQSAIYEIEQALNRIRNGTYGVCELTQKPIEPERLQAIPWTRFSLQAQRELEERGAVDRVRLGPRESLAGPGDEAEEEEEAEEA